MKNYKELVYKYNLLMDLMEHAPDVIYFKDTKGRLVMVNQAHARGLGLKPDQVVGKTDFDIFPKERAQKMLEDDLRVMKSGKPIIDKVERATRADGIDNYVSTTKIPRYDSKGKIIGLIGITRDITRRMQLEQIKEEKERLEKKIETLEEMNKLKSEFVSVVSHELRTPLAIIKEVISLIHEELAGPINEKQKNFLAKAVNNAERLKNMINELLDISRIESERFKLHYSLVNLNKLLQDSAQFFKKLAKDKGITLEYRLLHRQVSLFMDADRINQVLANLINNAIKFTESGGRIIVELKPLETKIRIGVMDTGIGIMKADLAKLFNKFIQVSHIASAKKEGVGLGLAIVKELVQKHGGEIWAESKLGVGSKFYFTLPRLYIKTALNSQIENKINDLLAKGRPIYLVNLVIVNYNEFRKKVRIRSAKLSRDLKEIIQRLAKDFKKENFQFFPTNIIRGECSIILAEVKEKQVLSFSELLKENIKAYFLKGKTENVFVHLSILPYTKELKAASVEHVLANVQVRKIYVGAEQRHFRRFNYKTEVGIVLAADTIEPSQTIDISEGGICFETTVKLQTDEVIKIRLELPGLLKSLAIKARVAWIKSIAHSAERGMKFKAGLEFIALKQEEKKAMHKFIGSLQAEA